MQFLTEETTYDYEISGEGPPVVLLHGFTGSKKTWAHLRGLLHDEFKVITIDLPGHGQTSLSPKTMDQCCNDLVQLLSFLNVDQTHIIGYSMGGRVALSFAMRYPQYVQSLVLESASPGLKRENDRKERIANDERLATKMEQEGIVQFVNFWEDIPLFATQKRLPMDVQQTIRNERLSQQVEGLSNSLRNMGTGKQPTWWEQLHHLTCETLLIVGEHDHKFVTINEQMEKKIKQASLVVVSDAGHAIHVEQPDFFGKLVISFLHKQHTQF